MVCRRREGTNRTHTRYAKRYEVLDLFDFPFFLRRLAASCHGCGMGVCVVSVACVYSCMEKVVWCECVVCHKCGVCAVSGECVHM